MPDPGYRPASEDPLLILAMDHRASFGRSLFNVRDDRPDAAQVAAMEAAKRLIYAGLAPVTRQSGKSINGESKSRRGNHRLKNAMFLAAFASLRSPDSKAFYDRKRAEGKRHNAALICLARRRCNVILAMLRTGQTYNPRHGTLDLAEAA